MQGEVVEVTLDERDVKEVPRDIQMHAHASSSFSSAPG
jgi:hypothetical protein